MALERNVTLQPDAPGIDRPSTSDRAARLFVFLSPECPLCQNYTLVLNQLSHHYAGKIAIYGIVPGKTVERSELTAFSEKYKIGYPLLMDPSMNFSNYLQASVTPEAILLDRQNNLIYKGAIDNWYKTLGKPGARATEHYLEDAIDHTLRHERPAIKRTRPVGCLLNNF